MNSNYFNIQKDIKIERAGGFFCEACIACYSIKEQSPNPRYCQQCYAILKEERESKKPISEIPVEEMTEKYAVATQDKSQPVTKCKSIANHAPRKIKVKNVTEKKTAKELLTKRVKRLTLQGKSSRIVTEELKKSGIIKSHMTISRMQKKIRQGVLL